MSARISAALAIINESKEKRYITKPKEIDFSGFLQFNIQDRAVPPFLPTFRFSVKRKNYIQLQDEINKLERFFEVSESEALSRDQWFSELQESIEAIGERIAQLDKVWGQIIQKLLDNTNITELIIYTNDAEVPWHWCYLDKKFLCDEKAIGTIWIEDLSKSFSSFIEDSYPQFEEFSDKEISCQLEGNYAFLLGSYGEEEADHGAFLPKVQEELETIENIINEKKLQFPLEVVNIMRMAHEDKGGSGDLPSQRKLLLQSYLYDFKNWGKIRLIHYSGHIEKATSDNDGCLITEPHDPITRQDFFRSFKADKGEPIPGPLIFLNGCGSGHIVNVWEKSASLSTYLLNRGASGVIVTTMPTDDESAFKLSEEFYKCLFGKADFVSYGEALRLARAKLTKRNPIRLLYNLYGDPASRLAHPPPAIDSVITKTAGFSPEPEFPIV